MPEAYARIAEVVSEAKALGGGVALPTPAVSRLPSGRPTHHYVWRTAGDAKVRTSHVARNGQIFAWANPPEHGHPGHEPNCRCWPEPYYGDPAVPDALLQLERTRRVNTDPDVLWASIDTLTRPDGTLAASDIVMTDGTQIRSAIAGSIVTNHVALPQGQVIRVESRNGTSTIHVGDDAVPLLQTRWGASGPTLTRTRRLAFLMDDPLGPDSQFDPVQVNLPPDAIVDPNRVGGLFSLDGPEGPGAIGAALLMLYLMRQAEPASMGAGKQDAAYVAFRAWTNGATPEGKVIPVPIAVGSITEEQARQACPLLPEVQSWTDQAALALAMDQSSRTGQNYGIRLHAMVKGEVDARKEDFPFIYRGVSAEYSISAVGGPSRYGEIDGRRLDVIERIPPEEPTVICDYEVKTGGARLSGSQLGDYVARLAARYPGATIFIFQIKPTFRPPR